VSVDLTGSDTGLTLVIADDGVGFDVDAVSAKGLGLDQHEGTSRAAARRRQFRAVGHCADDGEFAGQKIDDTFQEGRKSSATSTRARSRFDVVIKILTTVGPG
jgi:hypothetical protein